MFAIIEQETSTIRRYSMFEQTTQTFNIWENSSNSPTEIVEVCIPIDSALAIAENIGRPLTEVQNT